MTAKDLINIFLRLEMASKDETSDLAFDSGKDGVSPFGITGIFLDEDGDICLQSDARIQTTMNAKEIAEKVMAYDGDKTIYFVSVDEKGNTELYNIKDGGTRDRLSTGLRMISCGTLMEILSAYPAESLLHFESGTVNFTINSIYLDEFSCLCLESNEIEELDNYPISLILEALSEVGSSTDVYFYDDDSREFYGIYEEELRVGEEGDLWIKVR